VSDEEPPPGPGDTGDTGDPGEAPAAGKVGLGKRPDPGRIPPYALTAEEPGQVKVRRFRSGRRVPSAITAAVLLALAGLFLYDIASVRADRKAMRWRVRLADELATRHLGDVWIILGASVAAAVGLWLIVLALTPGRRSVLPMARHGAAGVRAGIDRHAAELDGSAVQVVLVGVRDGLNTDVGRFHGFFPGSMAKECGGADGEVSSQAV
jgi:hypothetical protein